MKVKFINDKEKFYKKLFWYKSFFYRNIEFKTNIKDEELKPIIYAMNIKKKNKRIEYIYDYCCKKIDNFYNGKNICKFTNNQCLAHQVPNCNYKNGCCRLCANQSNKGCTTANLSCKLFYCDQVKKENEIIKFKDLKILKLLSLRQRFIVRDNFFASRKEFLLELKLGSFMFYAFRTLIRIFKNFIYVKKIKE